MAVRHHGRPHGLTNTSDDSEARLFHEPRRHFEAFRIIPERLRFHEVDPVLGLVGRGFGWIELEAQRYRNYTTSLRVRIAAWASSSRRSSSRTRSRSRRC